ncbi:hypothetical protein CES85_4972 [Ochrobactrum quorumnocens]|uniref:Uncharacterized protein n=1 Tax=Ochrobactrum quorumnocens TaxID=271865 RepID=A0A248UCB7_9HYPH|nr:hypothetical protein CES85_4972 [[Ochrobactrum] quorumnocens]
MIVWKTGIAIIVPVSVVAKYRDHYTGFSARLPAMSKRCLFGLWTLVGAPKKTMLGITL